MSLGKMLAIAYLASACTGLSSSQLDGEMAGGKVGTGDGEVDTKGEEGGVVLGERYAMTNTFSIPAASVAPETIYELLSDLNNDPGHALVVLADAAGVPAAERLFDALPESLEGRIEQWITDAIQADGLEELRAVMALSQFVLADVEVTSTLSIAALATDGTSEATHTLTSFAFTIGDEVIEEDIPQIASLPGAGHSDVSVRTFQDADGLHLSVAEHRFGLLFGEAAFRAFESKLESQYGTNLRGVLGDAVDCPAVAQEVAGRCVLGVCVGHKEELEGLCNGALDSAADTVHEQFSSLDTEILILEQGEARLEATPTGSKLTDGMWQAQADLGVGMRNVPASFAAESF